MLAAAPNAAYIHEPFNQELKLGLSPNNLKHTFKYVSEFNSEEYKNWFEGILNYDYPFMGNLKKISSFDEALKVIRKKGCATLNKFKRCRPIIKDPIAFFSAEWIHQNFNSDVLIMIRNPAAFCSSLKIKKWSFNFNYFLDQPQLIQRYLSRFEKEIEDLARNKKSIIEQAILLWNCIHHTALIYKKEHPDWLFVKHEDISLDPLNEFRRIYGKFDLEFTPAVEEKILESTGAHNPAEQQKENEFVRDSKRNIHNWKNRLSREEIELIREKTSDISAAFYPGDSWYNIQQ